jgi:hypothetical protein
VQRNNYDKIRLIYSRKEYGRYNDYRKLKAFIGINARAKLIMAGDKIGQGNGNLKEENFMY